MLNVRQVRGNWNEKRIQQIINAALNQEIFSYFESNDGSTQWVGIGSTSRVVPKDSEDRFKSVKKWFEEIKKEIPAKIDLDTIAVLGGFSFDKSNKDHTTWADWSNGIFVLPRIILKITSDQIIVSEIKKHAFSNDTVEDVLDKIIKMSVSTSGLKNYSLKNLDPDWTKQVDQLAKRIDQSTSLTKVVIGRYKQGTIDGNIDPVDVLKALRALNKSNYHFMLKIKGQLFISATPERLFKLADKHFSTAAIAGTIGRGMSDLEDNKLALELYKDDKNRQEHKIVVDEITSRIKKFSNHLEENDMPMILKNQTVQHLYTPIQSEIDEKINVFDLIKTMHPTPALGGMPQQESMQVIKEIEPKDRVLFGAPIGYITMAGNTEMIVGIRAMYLHYDKFLMFAGAGIMPNSIGSAEFAETDLKFQPMIKLLQYLEER